MDASARARTDTDPCLSPRGFGGDDRGRELRSVVRILAVCVGAVILGAPAEAQNRLGSSWTTFGPGTLSATRILVTSPVPGQESGVAQCVVGGVNPGASYAASGKFWFNVGSSLPIIFVRARWYSDESCSVWLATQSTDRDLWEASNGSTWIMGATFTAPAGARSVEYQIGVRADSVTKVDLGLSDQQFSGPVGVRASIEALDPLHLCGPGSVRLRALATGGSGTYTKYTWYRNQTLFAQGPESELTVTQPGEWVVSVTDSAPSTSPQSASVTVSGGVVPVVASVQSNSPVCAGGSIALSAAPVAGAAWFWTGPQGFVSNLRQPTIPNATTAMSGTYSVTATVNGCTSDAATTNVVVASFLVAPVAGNNGPACEGETVQLDASFLEGATYAWIGPNGFTATEMLPTLSSVTPAMAGVYSVTTTVNGCTSPAGTTEVVVRAAPATPSITAPSRLFPEQAFTATVPGAPGVAWGWTVTNGTVTEGQGTSQVSVTAAATGAVTISVIGTDAVTECASSEASVVVPIGIPATRFFPVTPCRLFDTREAAGASAAAPALAPGETRTLEIGTRCGISSGTVRALSVNQTATQQMADGALVLYRGDLVSEPLASSISFRSGRDRANNGILELSREGDGTIKVHNPSAGTVHLIVDVNGTFQ